MNQNASIGQLNSGSSQKFGPFLGHVLQLRHMNQSTFATRANVSQSLISKLLADQRDMTESLSEKFSNALGGTPSGWMAIFRETKSMTSRPLAHLVTDLFGETTLGVGSSRPFIGTPIRQLREEAIKLVFGQPKAVSPPTNSNYDDCEMEDFDSKRVSMTSYDTVAGMEGIERYKNGDWNGKPFSGSFVIPAGKHKFVGTRECITLPTWLEAELHPASNIALKPLIVTHGPIIDPGFHGRLYVSVYNPTETDIKIDDDEPFLTLRFWVAETDVTPI